MLGPSFPYNSQNSELLLGFSEHAKGYPTGKSMPYLGTEGSLIGCTVGGCLYRRKPGTERPSIVVAYVSLVADRCLELMA